MSSNANSNDGWKTVPGKYVPPSSSAYVVPSLRKAPEPKFEDMFPVGLVAPVASKSTAAWGNFKEAVQKVNNTDYVPHVDEGILASFTNPLTGITTVVRDMVTHPNDKDDNTHIALSTFSSKLKKPVSSKRKMIDEDCDDDSFQEEQNDNADDVHCDSFSEPDSNDEEEVINDDVTY